MPTAQGIRAGRAFVEVFGGAVVAWADGQIDTLALFIASGACALPRRPRT